MPTKGTKPVTIDDYISAFSPQVQAILHRIRKTVRSAAPGAQEVISYQMPAFRLNGVLVYFAAFQKHIGLFPPVSGDAGLERAISPYAGEKGNLRFPLDQPIPYDLIARIAKHRLKQDLAKAATKKKPKRSLNSAGSWSRGRAEGSKVELVQQGGYWLWSDSCAGVEVRFAGCGPGGARAAVLAAIEGEALPVRWAKQVHGCSVLPIAAEDPTVETGPSGEGDALVTSATDVALAIATADCVPVLLATEGAIAAAHAGWRGVVARVVPAAIAALRARAGGPSAPVQAWIGPAIGVCCYEVGEDVAAAVAAASTPAVLEPHVEGRPHLDVPAAVRHQLRAAGVDEIREVAVCTRCSEDRLWSYRRDGGQAGRNLAFVWRSA